MSLRRSIERELVDGLAPRRRRALVERLRGNAAERRGWDRAIAAFRVLEQREVSRTELDQVERWLFDDLDELEGQGGVAADARRWARRRRSWIAAALASLASAAALLVWIGVGDGPQQRDESGLQPRGGHGWDRPLAIDPVCGEPARPVRARGCELDELLGFSLRLGDEALEPAAAAALARAPLHTSVFGIGADGEPLYYLPTPDQPAGLTLELGGSWQALPLSIRLGVNHAPGRTRVFALASDAPASVADIQRWAVALASQPGVDLDDPNAPPWHLRLPARVLGPVCAQTQRCASAETELMIHPKTPGREPELELAPDPRTKP